METYWLIGSKSAYTSAFDQGPFAANEDERSGLNFHQATMFENSGQPVFHRQSSPETHTTPGRRASVILERCPFSGVQGSFE